MSVVYAVLAHHLPDQTARLVRRLLPGDHTVVLHVNRRSDERPFAAALADEVAAGRVRLARRRVACRWGDYSLVEAALATTSQALDDAPRASHVVLLSGQDYPIAPPEVITEHFAAAHGRSFLFASRGDGEEPVDRTGNLLWSWNGRLDRLGRWYLAPGRSRVALPNQYTPFLPHRRMPAGLEPVHGSMWWGLSRGAAVHVVDVVRRTPSVPRFFKHVLIPDEHVVPMVVAASPYWGQVVQDDLHHITWQGYHPAVLTTADLPGLRASPKLFARKFDVRVDAAVLDRLDEAHTGAVLR